MVQIGGSPVQQERRASLEKDPVCGMNVDPVSRSRHCSHIGKTYYFCRRGCGEKFQGRPCEVFVGQAAASSKATPLSAGDSLAPAAPAHRRTFVRWIPRSGRTARGLSQVRHGAGARDSCSRRHARSGPAPCIPRSCATRPGACPICGMALEPTTVTAAEEENPELRDMTRRFWASVLLGVPLVAFAMLRMGPLAHRAHAACAVPGSNSPWRRRSCCGRAGRSSSAAGRR